MDHGRLRWAIVNICVLASLLAPKTAIHFISIIFAHNVAVTCFSTPPESDSPRDEMIGGRLAEPNIFPWYTIIFQIIDFCVIFIRLCFRMLQMCYKRQNRPGYWCFCGATLITSRHALTAFHCVALKDPCLKHDFSKGDLGAVQCPFIT